MLLPSLLIPNRRWPIGEIVLHDGGPRRVHPFSAWLQPGCLVLLPPVLGNQRARQAVQPGRCNRASRRNPPAPPCTPPALEPSYAAGVLGRQKCKSLRGAAGYSRPLWFVATNKT